MDEHLMLECKSEPEAQDAADRIHQKRITDLQAQGYTIIGNEIVGKNAQTGLDDLTAQRTLLWDEVKPTTEGTFYIESFTGVRDIIDGVEDTDFREVPKQPTWPDTETDGAFSTRFSTDFDNGT